MRDTIRALPPAPPFDKVAKSERLTGTDHWLDERHRVLFVSPEAFAEILKNFPEASHGG